MGQVELEDSIKGSKLRWAINSIQKQQLDQRLQLTLRKDLRQGEVHPSLINLTFKQILFQHYIHNSNEKCESMLLTLSEYFLQET